MRHGETQGLVMAGLRKLLETMESGCRFALARGCLFAGRQDHHHLAAFELGHGFHLHEFVQVVPHALKYTHAQLLMGHFTATKPQSNLGLVAFFDEATQIAQLDLVIAFISTRTELHFLDLDDFLLGARFLLALLLLILELAVIHHAADRRGCVGRDLDQIHVILLGQVQSLGRFVYPELLALRAYEANLGYTDFTIDAM